jgi:acyl carrier protein
MISLSPEEIDQQIRETVAAVLKKKPGEISPTSRLFEELGADSLTAVEILAFLDKKFGLDLPEEKLVGVKTYAQLVNLVKEELKKKTK